ESVNMGTRFCATVEAPIHDGIKQTLASATERDTLHISRTLSTTGRVLKNPVAEQVLALERRPGCSTYEDLRELVAGARGRAGLESGDPNSGLVWASQVVGIIDDIPTCAELLERMVADCRAALREAMERVLP